MEIQIPEAFEPLFTPSRYKVYYGGRGAGKSWAIARILLLMAAQEPKRILCTRELQQSIQESVHRLLSDQIEVMGLSSFYEVQKATIKGKNGSEFIFEGLRNNVTKIKSMEAVDIVWAEEAENIPEHSWDVLIPTIRKPGSEIWVSFNPHDEMDDTYQRFVLNPPDDAIVRKVSWRDNPWFPVELMREMEDLRDRDYHKYLHVWEGEPSQDYGDSLIKPEWVEAAIDSHKKLNFMPQGAIVTGYDPADEGSDAQGLAVRHGSVVLKVDQNATVDLDKGVTWAFSEAFESRSQSLVYDATGIGAGVKVGLDKRIAGRNISVEPFVSAATPDNPNTKYMGDRPNKDLFKNKRAQYWWYLRDRFEKTYRAVNGEYGLDTDELISIPGDCPHLNQLKSELVRVQRKRGENNKIQLERKTEMMKRGMKSPNMADALAMAFANSPPRPKTVTLNFQSEW